MNMGMNKISSGNLAGINQALGSTGTALEEASKNLANLGPDATFKEINDAQNVIQDLRTKFDLLQQIRQMIVEIFNTIIRNINPR